MTSIRTLPHWIPGPCPAIHWGEKRRAHRSTPRNPAIRCHCHPAPSEGSAHSRSWEFNLSRTNRANSSGCRGHPGSPSPLRDPRHDYPPTLRLTPGAMGIQLRESARPANLLAPYTLRRDPHRHGHPPPDRRDPNCCQRGSEHHRGNHSR